MLSASAAPDTGCAITAFKVNIASAITTVRAVVAMVAASPVRCAMYMKNAMPSPVPNRTAEKVHKLENQDGGHRALSLTGYGSCCRPSKTHVNALMAHGRDGWRRR